MSTAKSFTAGLVGGVLSATLVVAVAVWGLGLGDPATSAVVPQDSSPALVTEDQPENRGFPATPALAGGTLSPEQIYKSFSGGVVMVLSSFDTESAGPFGGGSSQALGTGFVVDKQGYILTNAHVVNEQGETARELTVVLNKDGSKTRRVKGQLVGVDVSSDVAVVKVNPEGLGLQPLPLGNSSAVVVGEPVVAIGNPLGYDFSITSGIVSATGRSLQAPNGMTIPNGIQTDAAINRGNSGGPLINSRGKVIGINEQIASQSGGSQGLGFAVPINTAVRSMNQIRKTGTVEYAWLGVSGQTLSRDIAGLFGINSQGGALVETVSPSSPAAEAGVRGGDRTSTMQDQTFTLGGDIIVAMNDTAIESFDDLIAFLGEKRPGDRVIVAVERDGQRKELTVTLRRRPANL